MDLIALQKAILNQFVPGRDSIHGPSHWQRAEAFGLKLAEGTDANIDVIRLFALFHDACRLHDGGDREHGPRGAELATKWRGKYFSLPDVAFDQLTYAAAGTPKDACAKTSPSPSAGMPTASTSPASAQP